MAHLFKAVTIVQKSSPLHGQVVDILIKDGKIVQIGQELTNPEAQVIKQEGLCCSIGWFDLTAFVGEPGLEHRETIQSLITAAAYGGFTEVACLPNVNPVTQTKSAVEFLQQKSVGKPTRLHAIAAVTHHLDGKDLAELIDLKEAGAIAFSDGHTSIQASDTVLKALEYLKIFDGVLINRSENEKMSHGGQMHEGVASTRLGLKGIPAMAEEMQVKRDLQLLEYSNSRLHISQVSTAGALRAIKKAKQEGLQVTCDIAAHQVAFTDETIEPFDTNYKVSPPFRSQLDKEAIQEGIMDGTIDTIVSGHTPWDEEAKELEFDLAESGIIGLQTAFSAAVASLGPIVSWEQVVSMLSEKSREIVSLPVPAIEAGAQANLTFFHPTVKWVFTEALNASKSSNSPFLGKELTGCVYATCFQNQVTLNPSFPV